jgi:hypothetical protein
MNTELYQLKFAPAQDVIPEKDSVFNLGGCSVLKQCTKCKIKKPLNEFPKQKRYKNGIGSWCKKCKCENSNQQYLKHPETFRKHSKNQYAKYPERHKKLCKQWVLKNPDKKRAISLKAVKKWNLLNREKYLERLRNRTKKRISTLHGTLNNRMSSDMWESLRSKKANRHWETLVGFTLEDLKKHLESQFKDGMSWERFMNGEIHIDHKIPKSFFIYEKPEDQEFQYCWSLDNLQPLWAKDNQSKNTKTMEEWKEKKVTDLC